MISARWIALGFVLILSAGCVTPNVRPNSSIKRSFDAVDSLRVESSSLGESTVVSDSVTIDRLKEIHARSKWDPMPATLPLDMIAIYGITSGEERFKLVYGAGWLMDTKDGEIVRMGTLNEDDREWMQTEIRSKLPPNPGIL